MQRSDSSFQIVWRYFSWSNQTLAMIALWVATAYLLQKGKMKYGSLLTALQLLLCPLSARPIF